MGRRGASSGDGAGSETVEVFVPPSPEALCLVRRLGWLIAPPEGRERWYTRAFGFLIVAPFTQLTLRSFDLQAFLFQVFHTRLPARVGHALFMPVVNFFVMAALAGLRLGPHPTSHGWPGPSLNGATGYALILLLWYFIVARGERLYLWWLFTVPLTLGLAFGADAFHCCTFTLDAAQRTFLAPSPLVANPFLWMAVAAALVAFSHGPEPRLPPRVGESREWTEHRRFLFGPREAAVSPARLVRRLLLLAIQLVSGTLNEWWASPRLMPYNLLLLMFRAGYRPDVAERTRHHAERALASGNPAIDFVGIGGGAFLRVDERLRRSS